MSQKTVQNCPELARAIKSRRNELSMTIEDAAIKAGVGTKTWCRYEAGEPIRQDKCKGLCRGLNWRTLPFSDKENDSEFNINQYRNSACWSKFIEKNYGITAAASFVIGSEILEDYINQEMDELARMPKGSHLGELGFSILASDLPPQFLTRYDYEFLYALRSSLLRLKSSAKLGQALVAHTIMEELVFYLIVEESRMLLEEGEYTPEHGWDTWIFDLFGDMDIVTLLYSDLYISPANIYHFDHWMEEQLYMS